MTNENEEENDTPKNEEEETSEETPKETPEETPKTSSDEELNKQKELAENYKKRAEKAERDLKDLKGKTEEKSSESSSQEQLSAKDFLALKDADISAEDFDEVQSYAAYRKISIGDALKDKTLKTILMDKKEERNSAEAAQTKGSPRGASKISDEDLLKKAETTGEVPATEEGMRRLAEARIARKKAELNRLNK